jgi:hypothetical protein
LVGLDGNAFAILGRAGEVLKKGGREDLKEQFMEEAMSGDYDNLLRICMKYFNCDEDEKE